MFLYEEKRFVGLKLVGGTQNLVSWKFPFSLRMLSAFEYNMLLSVMFTRSLLRTMEMLKLSFSYIQNPIIIFRNITIRKHEENILQKNDAINRYYTCFYPSIISHVSLMRLSYALRCLWNSFHFHFATFVYIFTLWSFQLH